MARAIGPKKLHRFAREAGLLEVARKHSSPLWQALARIAR